MTLCETRYGLTFLALWALIVVPNTFGQPPNIIVILADDLGWTDLETDATSLGNGSDYYLTPNINSLAEQGMSFAHAYTCGANCAPMRASFLTGQYAIRSTNNVFNVGNLNRGNNKNNSTLDGQAQGVDDLGGDQIPASAVTVAELLKFAGYATAHFGKFHVGTAAGVNSITNQGFDQNFGGASNGNPGSGGYFSNGTNFGPNIGKGLDPYAADYTSAQSQALTKSEVLTGTRKHLTDGITEGAIDFMIQTQNTPGEPFFLHIGHYAVHTPINGSGRPDLVAKYKGIQPGKRHRDPDYAALVEGIDQSVGQLMKFLTDTDDINNPGKKLSDTTFVMFYSDNGGLEGATENQPLRSQKGEYREGGIRVPLIAWMPSLIPAATTNNAAVMSADFWPTFAELANVNPRVVLPQHYEPIDGISLLGILGDPHGQLERDAIYWHFPGYLIDNSRNQRPESIVRSGPYKLIFGYENRSYQLYNVESDLDETNNLAKNPNFYGVARDLSIKLRSFITENNAKLPFDRFTLKTVEPPPVFQPTNLLTFDFGSGNNPNNSQNGGAGNWDPFPDNSVNASVTFSNSIGGVQMTIAGVAGKDVADEALWGSNSQGIGIRTNGESGDDTQRRRISGDIGEGIEFFFGADVQLTSMRLGNFTDGEFVTLEVGGKQTLTIASNDEGPLFDYPTNNISVKSGQRVLISGSNGAFLFNEISVESKAVMLKGDVNLDGNIDLLDVEPFVQLLSTGFYQQSGDIDCDGEVNLLDVTLFVQLLNGK